MYDLPSCDKVTVQVNAITIGSILDHYGPRVTAITGALFFALGTLLFGFGTESTLVFSIALI
jgi:hypothetical protein